MSASRADHAALRWRVRCFGIWAAGQRTKQCHRGEHTENGLAGLRPKSATDDALDCAVAEDGVLEGLG